MAFLEKLINYGVGKNFFSTYQIKDLEKSCCENCIIEVYDFDATKEGICNLLSLRSYKSCDALKILLEKERIDFIEMKGLKDFLNPKFPNKNNFDAKGDQTLQIINKVQSFDIIDKIQESLDLLKLIINGNDFNLTNAEKNIFKEIPKNFIIVTDISSQENGLEFLMTTLEVLSENSSSIEEICSEIFSDEIENTKFPNIYNIQQPIPMTCEGLINFYK
jgi:hypothetical protein